MQVEELTPAEEQWLAQQRETARLICDRYLDESVAAPPSIDQVHRAYDAWNRSRTKKLRLRKDAHPNDVCLALGVAFGDHIRDALEMDWKIITDEYGTDIQLHREVDGNVLSLPPTNIFAKRIESGDSNWIEPLARAMIETIQEQIEQARQT